MDRYREFYEEAGKKYPEDRITYSSLSGLIRKKWVMERLKTMADGNLLDCGCNIGRLSANWKRGEIYGIDIAFSVIVKAKKIFPQINFIQGDLREMGFIKDDSIDNAIAVEVLEHLDRPEDFLQGLYRTMKPGGKILITTPGYSHSRPWLVPLGTIQSFGISQGTEAEYYLHTAYKPEELTSLIKKAGFEIIEAGSFEYELRAWVKPLIIMTRLFEGLSRRFFRFSKLNYLFMCASHSLEVNLFIILDTFGLSAVLKKILKEGRRSYVLARRQEG